MRCRHAAHQAASLVRRRRRRLTMSTLCVRVPNVRNCRDPDPLTAERCLPCESKLHLGRIVAADKRAGCYANQSGGMSASC